MEVNENKTASEQIMKELQEIRKENKELKEALKLSLINQATIMEEMLEKANEENNSKSFTTLKLAIFSTFRELDDLKTEDEKKAESDDGIKNFINDFIKLFG
jgi:hypothetical protein